MSHPENWELQLAPLINTADLLSVFEPDNGVLAGITMKSAHSSPQPRSSRTSNESATALLPDAVYRNGATNKATKDRVEIISYPMNGAGAKKCLREAVMLKRPSLCAEHQTSATRRGLQHIISPLGIWTTAETSLLHLVMNNPGILTLAKYLDSPTTLPSDLIRTILVGTLEALELCHANGIAHCAVHPDTILLHSCSSIGVGQSCTQECDFANTARRPFPVNTVSVQIGSFDNSIEFVPVVSDTAHLPLLHEKMCPFWSAPELCSVAVKPKSKLRKRALRESGGKVDIWSVGILALVLIERNIALSPLSMRSKDSLSTGQMQEWTTKQVSRLKASPKILQSKRWTTLAQDFVLSCLRIDPSARPSAASLLKHPFLTNSSENCLMSLSDVSESEASNLEDTYEDSTTYIPAPDSDSEHGSTDWSEDDDDQPPSPRLANHASTESLRRRSSEEVPEYLQDQHSAEFDSDEDLLLSSEGSTGSVVIVSNDIPTEKIEIVAPKQNSYSTATLSARRRGLSDASRDEPSPHSSPSDNHPHYQGRHHVHTISRSASSSSLHGSSPKSRPSVSPPRTRTQPSPSASSLSARAPSPSPAPTVAKSETPPRVIRRKLSSELIDMHRHPSPGLQTSPSAPSSSSPTRSNRASPDADTPLANSGLPSSTSMIAVRTKSKHEHESTKSPSGGSSSSKRAVTSSAPSSTTLHSTSSALVPPAAVMHPPLFLPPTATPISPNTSSTSVSTSSSKGSPATVAAVARDRTPSPAKNSITKMSVAGRRSSLPLLPLSGLSNAYTATSPLSAPSSAHSSGPVTYAPLQNLKHHTRITGASAAAAQPAAPNAPFHPPSETSLTASLPNIAHPTTTPTLSPASAPVHSHPAHPATPTPSASSTPVHSPPQPQSHQSHQPHQQYLTPPSSSSSSSSVSSPSTKASTTTIGETHKPVFMSKSMRSRSEDILIDKETLERMRTHTPSGFPTNMPMSARSPDYSSTGVTSPTSAHKSHRKKLKKQRSYQGDPSPLPSSPSSSTLPSGSVGGSAGALSAGSGSIGNDGIAAGGNAETALDDVEVALASQIEECETRWFGEIRKKQKAWELREKELSEKYEQRLRAAQKRYDTQILALSKRDEQRSTEWKQRSEEERARLMGERQRELDKEEMAGRRRNSFSGGSAPTQPLRESRKPQFQKRVLHINFEKSMYEVERKLMSERQEIELRSLEDTAAIEGDLEIQKYLAEQSNLEQQQECQRNRLEEVYALKAKMNEETKALSRKHTNRKVKKLSEAIVKPANEDTILTASAGTWRSLLSPPSNSGKAGTEPIGSTSDFSFSSLHVPRELSWPVQDRFMRYVELQEWKQKLELASLAREIKWAEQYKSESSAMYHRHATELGELRNGFDAHFAHKRQIFIGEMLNRMCLGELELAELKARFLKRMIVKSEDDPHAEDSIIAQHEEDRVRINDFYTNKKEQLKQIASSFTPSRNSLSFGQLPTLDETNSPFQSTEAP